MSDKSVTWESIADKALDKAGDVFTSVSNVLNNAVTEYGPDVVNAVLWVIRIDNLQSLVIGLLFLIIYVIILRFLWINVIKKEYLRCDREIINMDTGTIFVPGLVGVIITFMVFGLTSVPKVFDAWTYVGIVEPKLWIAKQVIIKLDKATETSAQTAKSSK